MTAVIDPYLQIFYPGGGGGSHYATEDVIEELINTQIAVRAGRPDLQKGDTQHTLILLSDLQLGKDVYSTLESFIVASFMVCTFDLLHNARCMT